MGHPGVPLGHYVGNRRARVRLHCQACARAVDLDVAAVIERLKARGVGDEKTGVRSVGPFAEKPCANCGARTFLSTPGWV